MLSEPLQVVARLVRTFYGIPRATQDVDLVAELQLEHVQPLSEALAGDFYIDADTVRNAIQRRASFNVIHWQTMFKADIFVSPEDDWSKSEMTRARPESFDTPEGRISIHFASAEDTLLHKLAWYKLGNEVSDRQWGDILGLLKVQAGALDNEYLRMWAVRLGVSSLLSRAETEHQAASNTHGESEPGSDTNYRE